MAASREPPRKKRAIGKLSGPAAGCITPALAQQVASIVQGGTLPAWEVPVPGATQGQCRPVTNPSWAVERMLPEQTLPPREPWPGSRRQRGTNLQHTGMLRCMFVILKVMLGPAKCSGTDGIARPNARTAALLGKGSHLLAVGAAPVAEAAARAAACLRLHLAGHLRQCQGLAQSQVPHRRCLREVSHPLATCHGGHPSAQV